MMKLIGVMLARNEAWVIEASLRAALRWCDEMIVLVHASSDDTEEIVQCVADAHPGRVEILHEVSLVWKEMEHRQRTLERARAHGATHVAIVDADEMLTENLVPKIRDLTKMPLLQLPWIMCWKSLEQYCARSPVWRGVQVSFVFEDMPSLHWHSRAVLGAANYEFHQRLPFGREWKDVAYAPLNIKAGGVLHLQHVVWKRLLAKHALYKMTELLRWGGRPGFMVSDINKRYDSSVSEDGVQLEAIPTEWRPPELSLIDTSLPIWHVGECQRFMTEHGPEKFKGLNLYGIA